MRFIPTRTHGVLDYLVGVVLILLPYLFGFADRSWAQWLPQALGVFVLLYSVLTDYELGLYRAIRMPIHLALDMAGGVLLAVSPWLFGFADRVWLPHLVVGLVEIGTAMMTRTEPDTAAAPSGFGTVEAPEDG